MNTLLNSERDEDVEDMHARGNYSGAYAKDREITLGTTMVLGIFFALAVFGAVFFGFGYSMGAKHAMASNGVVGEGGSVPTFNTFKPAPGSPIGAPVAPSPAGSVTVPFTAPATVPKPAPKPAAEAFNPDEVPAAVPTALPVPVLSKPPVRTAASLVPVPVPVVGIPSATPAAAGQSMVQVAAVSHPEDADLLVSTLKRRGYAVAIHSEPQDKLLHVQIGPFPNKADASAMRLKLQADGFNAIVK